MDDIQSSRTTQADDSPYLSTASQHVSMQVQEPSTNGSSNETGRDRLLSQEPRDQENQSPLSGTNNRSSLLAGDGSSELQDLDDDMMSPSRRRSPSISLGSCPFQEYNHESSEEFPNGDTVIVRHVGPSVNDIDARSTGWAMHRYRHHKRGSRVSLGRSCLGIYKCPEQGCEFTKRPRALRGSAKKHAIPLPENSTCSIHHDTVLIHVPCKAILNVIHQGNVVRLEHRGFHNHPKPQALRPDIESKKKMEELVRTAPKVLPKQLQLGTTTRDAVSKIHPMYLNRDRVAYERKRILKGTTTTTTTTIGSFFSAIKAFEDENCPGAIRSQSRSKHNGHICFQTEFMLRMAGKLDTCMQSDSLHSFVVDEQHNDDDVHLTLTSTYCPTIQRTVPLLISILYGKTHDHYRVHFQVLFASLPYKTWQEFIDNFTGMTLFISDAERVGFEQALRAHYQVPEMEDIELERFYRCREVHFKRSLTKVGWNGAVVPSFDASRFYHSALRLLNPDHTQQTFDSLVSEIRNEYPKTKGWFDWYLNPSRGKHIFPTLCDAADDDEVSTLSRNTNAQETLGRDFQRQAAPKKKLSIPETFQHAFRYMALIETDYGLQSQSVSVRDGRRKRNRMDASPLPPATDLEEMAGIDEPSSPILPASDPVNDGVKEVGEIEIKPKPKKVRKRKRHPKGLSIGIVTLDGKLPICKGCGQAIDRGAQRLLFTTKGNTTWSYHLSELCIEGLAEEEREKAKSFFTS